MKKIIDYIAVYGHTMDELSVNIQHESKNGYILRGNIKETCSLLYQVMVKYEKPKKMIEFTDFDDGLKFSVLIKNIQEIHKCADGTTIIYTLNSQGIQITESYEEVIQKINDL